MVHKIYLNKVVKKKKEKRYMGNMSIGALFEVTKNWKLKCSSIGKLFNKLWYILAVIL